MQTYAILVQNKADSKMEADIRELRREQDRDLRSAEQARRDMEKAIEVELGKGAEVAKWPECAAPARHKRQS